MIYFDLKFYVGHPVEVDCYTLYKNKRYCEM